MKYVIANLKSNKNTAEVADWIQSYTGKKSDAVTAILAPSLVHLTQVSDAGDDRFALAAQDVSQFPMGSYTGAVNARQLKEIGVQYAIVGHSERRRYFGETHAQIANKIAQLLDEGITPVLCLDTEYIVEQAAVMDPEHQKKIIVAYEPLSAIGSGKNQDVGTVTEVVKEIHQVYDDQVPVLYGGSVTEDNVREYSLVCDGVLVGGASLDPKHFSRIVAAITA